MRVFGSLVAPVIVASFLICCSDTAAGEKRADAKGMALFESKIRPVLVSHCYHCHSDKSKSVKGGLRLDTRDGIRKGGDSGPAVVPGDLKKSLILPALRHESFEMPPEKKLPERVVADFTNWIKLGAPDPRVGKPAAGNTSAGSIDFKQARRFWSFQPPRKHQVAKLSDPEWVQTGIDRFILAKLDAEGLSPNRQADRRTLIRRLSFSVTGLPPSPADVREFLADNRPDAYRRLVDRLLRSRHYGERWARLWLDVARYAEDQAHIVGNNQALFYPNAYLYRDWVIGALNADMPYDEFLRRQLATDLIEPDNQKDLPALGFIGLGPKYYRRRAPEVMADEWEDRVDTVSRGLLGLTVACARCHDHKYDPIPTTDYYALAGVFASTQMYNKPLNPAKGGKRKKKKRKDKSPVDTMHIVRDGKPRDIHVQIRGNHKTKGPLVKRRFLRVLSPGEPKEFTSGSGRRELAEAIASKRNPLTARVIVNRVWAEHFGRPLVATPSNFGALGARPTHPRLLDDLAARFMEQGWSLKWLHREILMSATWRQSSELVSANQSVDPSNKWLSRMNRRRLGVEAWRDALLSASGRLDRTLGGKSIDPQDPASTRRTVYSRISRLKLNPMLAMFDVPDPNAHAARRVETTTPLQKMFVLNSPFIVRQAEALAQRCLASGDDDEGRIRWAYETLYGRPAGPREVELGRAFLRGSTKGAADRWERYVQVLLAANEMLYVD